MPESTMDMMRKKYDEFAQLFFDTDEDKIASWLADTYDRDHLFALLGKGWTAQDGELMPARFDRLRCELASFKDFKERARRGVVFEYIIHNRNKPDEIVDSGLFSTTEAGTHWAEKRCDHLKHGYKAKKVWLRHNAVDAVSNDDEDEDTLG